VSVRSALSLDHWVVDGAVFVVGLVALVAAAVVSFGGSVGDPLVAALAPLFGPWLVGVGGLLAGGLAVYTAYERSTLPETGTAATVSVPVPPSRRDEANVSTAGGRLDTLVEEIHADDLDEDVSRVDASVNRRRVRGRIRGVAVAVLVDTKDCTGEAAREMLATGSWTDRPRARAFLGDDVSRLPLSVRLRDWASGEQFRRRASATIEEVATQAGVDHGESIAPSASEADGRDPIEWPPEPATDDDGERLDRLLDRPAEEFRQVPESEPKPGPDLEPGPEPETETTAEVFRREVIPGDVATNGAGGARVDESTGRTADGPATGGSTASSAPGLEREHTGGDHE